MTHFVNYVYNGAPFSQSKESVVELNREGTHSGSGWREPTSSKTYRSVIVDETSSLASSSSSNDIFPDDFDHRRYTDPSHVVTTTIPTGRTNSHTHQLSTHEERPRKQHRHNRQQHLTNGYSGKGHSKDIQPTLRSVSFDSGFDTSNQRLDSFSSDDSSRWREIKPEKPKVVQSDPNMGKPVEKKFLRKVQRELEEQRTQWESEVDELTGSMARMPTPSGGSSKMQGESSYVDTSGHKPMFKAFVDMKGYPPRNISVNVDNVANKVIVTALQNVGTNGVTRTFTQKISLPRFADEQALTSRLSKTGMLKIEVPLMYYFPQPEDAKSRDRKAKSFVYQVEKPDRDGPRVLEILVNTGSEFRAKELKVLVEDDSKLVILGEKHTMDSRGHAGVKRKLIKQYSLPGMANVDRITSKLGKDGRLQVNVPLRD